MGRHDDLIESVRRVEQAQADRYCARQERDERTRKVERILTCSGLSTDQVTALAELIAVVYDGERDDTDD